VFYFQYIVIMEDNCMNKARESQGMDEFMKPLLCAGSDGASQEAFRMLRSAGIDFYIWDANAVKPADWKPPFVTSGRNVYLGLAEIERFTRDYPAIRNVEKGIYRVA